MPVTRTGKSSYRMVYLAGDALFLSLLVVFVIWHARTYAERIIRKPKHAGGYGTPVLILTVRRQSRKWLSTAG